MSSQYAGARCNPWLVLLIWHICYGRTSRPRFGRARDRRTTPQRRRRTHSERGRGSSSCPKIHRRGLGATSCHPLAQGGAAPAVSAPADRSAAARRIGRCQARAFRTGDHRLSSVRVPAVRSLNASSGRARPGSAQAAGRNGSSHPQTHSSASSSTGSVSAAGSTRSRALAPWRHTKSSNGPAPMLLTVGQLDGRPPRTGIGPPAIPDLLACREVQHGIARPPVRVVILDVGMLHRVVPHPRVGELCQLRIRRVWVGRPVVDLVHRHDID